MGTAVAFITQTYNKYSICALAGTLESTLETADNPLYFLDGKSAAGLVKKLDSLAGRHKTILARYLSRLANKGLQFGQWKTQQKAAKDISAFTSRA